MALIFDRTFVRDDARGLVFFYAADGAKEIVCAVLFAALFDSQSDTAIIESQELQRYLTEKGDLLRSIARQKYDAGQWLLGHPIMITIDDVKAALASALI